MAGVNKVILIGNLGADPEIRYTPSGTPVATFTVATDERWVTRTNEEGRRTTWHRIVAWGKLAERCKDLLTKGKQVYLEGRLQTRSWEDQSGQKRYRTEIVANNLLLLGRAEEQLGAEELAEAGSASPRGEGDREEGPVAPEEEGDLPF